MPNIDAVTMATPAGAVPRTVQFLAPEDWEDGDYVAWVEVNVEGDYNDAFNDLSYPTPLSDRWDFWAQTYGYPYRGQPSVVYRLPFALGPVVEEHQTSEPAGYGTLHGESGDMFPIDASITDDPVAAPGSGAEPSLKASSPLRPPSSGRSAGPKGTSATARSSAPPPGATC